MDATFSGSNIFTVTNDRTAEFVTGRRIKANCVGDGYVYASVVSSNYVDPNTVVVIDETELTSNLITVLYGVVEPGATGSLPDHAHDGSEGSGGEITVSGVAGEDHSTLSNLDYASAGHTGFQPAGDYAANTDLVTVSGLTDTNASAISDNTTLIATTSGSLQNEIDSKAATLLELDDTPIAYDTDKYLQSTASGTEWATVFSTAGEDWVTRTPAADNGWRSVVWSPELTLFVAVAESGTDRVMTSPDGVTWTIRDSSADIHQWVSVCWSPELTLFAAVSDASGFWVDGIMTSPDGIVWTGRQILEKACKSVCWSPELTLFVVVASTGTGDRVLTSSSGESWTLRTSAADNDWQSVVWSPELTLFVAVAESGDGNRVMTSPDGINWDIQVSAANNDWQSVCWSPELTLFVAVAVSGDGNRVMTSPDGINWGTQSSPVDNQWQSVCWSPERSLFVAVARDGVGNNVMTSPDGINWDIQVSAADNDWQSVCWSPELASFAAVSLDGTGNRVMTSEASINHSKLNELDYASAGHTGFQPAGDYATNTDLVTVSGLTDTNASDISVNADAISDNTTLIATTSGTLQIQIDDIPAGADTEIQFNDGGTLAGDSNFTYDKVWRHLTLLGGNVTTHAQYTNTLFGDNIVVAGNLTGGSNTCVGSDAFPVATTANLNVGIGYRVFDDLTIGIKNVVIGAFAGMSIISGSRNIFIGNTAGFFETGSDKLYIDSSDTSTPLIYGDFAIGFLRINGDFDITGNLTVSGTSPFQPAGDYATSTDLATTSGTLQTQIDSIAKPVWTTITSTHTVVSGGQNIFVDTTGGAFTITMYDNPEEGQITTFMDKGGYSNTNNVTIAGGSEKLNGENQDLYLNENYGSFTLIYGDANSGWMSTTSPPFMTLDQA